MAGIYSFFDVNAELKDVVAEPLESGDAQTVPSSPSPGQLDARLDEIQQLHHQQQPHEHVPDQFEQRPAQATLSSSSSDNHSVRFNATGLFNIASSHLNSNNSAVSSNVSTGTASVQPVGVTGGGDRQDGNLFTGQETSGTMLSQILSTPGSVLAEDMDNSQGTGTIPPNKSVEALAEPMDYDVCPTCGRPF